MSHSFHFDRCCSDNNAPSIGWVCSYTPEEIILASGFEPYRIEASASGLGAEAYLPANVCPYVRSLLDAGLAAQPGNLAGMAFVYSCDAMRRLADLWERCSNIPILYRLDVPRRSDEIAETYLVARYRELLSALEQASGRRVGEEDLRNASEILNETRRLMSAMDRLRRSGALSGADFSEIACCAVTSDKRRFNAEAARFLALSQLCAREPESSKALLCGCALEGRRIHDLIEESGIMIVADDLCTGARHFDGLVDLSLDPLLGIARRYLRRRPCARMTGASARVDGLMNLADESGADGIIFLSLKFCDLVQSDLPRLQAAARHRGAPFLHIELDSPRDIDGQMKTRVEAFAEMMGRPR